MTYRPLLLIVALVAVSAPGLGAQSGGRGRGGGAESEERRASCPAPAPTPTYYAATQVDLLALIPPPPAADSPEQKADLAAVLAAQRASRTNGTLERALADSEQSCARFKDVLGPELKSAAAQKALQFISAAASGASRATGTPKSYWKRPRPFVVSSDVKALGDVAVGGEAAYGEYPDKHCVAPPPKNDEEAKQQQEARKKAEYERNNTSYPSGHAAYGMACAVLLAEMVPEKRAELFARARQYGESRSILGAHFPSDVAAGQQAGMLGAALEMQNAGFERELAKATPQLRVALGLSAEIPDLEPNKDMFKDKDEKGGEKSAGKDSAVR